MKPPVQSQDMRVPRLSAEPPSITPMLYPPKLLHDLALATNIHNIFDGRLTSISRLTCV